MLTPYLGAGFGYGWASESEGVAFSAMAGLELSLTDDFSVDMGYRYGQVVDEQSNEALIGLRFGF
jgi:opacity protein-like surface antigen